MFNTILSYTGIIDVGDPNLSCSNYNAIVWYEERSDKSKNTTNPNFSLCCMKGKIQLPYLQHPPQLLLNLLTDLDPRSKHFKENIRTYNSMFCFTSISRKVAKLINDGGCPPQFILSGQNFHRIGSLIPAIRSSPKFAQLYIYATQNEISNRMKHFRYRKFIKKFTFIVI